MPGATVSAIFDEDLQNYLGSSATSSCPTTSIPRLAQGGVRQHVLEHRRGAEADRCARHRQLRPDLFGQELDAFLMGKARGLARITAICEEVPSADNRIELSSEKDEFGFPLVRLIHSFQADAIGLFDAAIAEGVEIAKGAGAKEIWPGRAIGPQHLLGGTIMGKNASDSVVDSFGQAHELANLYVAGCGIFPTASSANPTFTLNALSLRGPSNWWRTGAASRAESRANVHRA